jgi:putative transcriptional regulator
MNKKRNLFEELTQGISEMCLHDTGKLTLRTLERTLPDKPVPQLTQEVIKLVRERLNASQAVFARYLRVSKRTLENWEQGKARPNGQAVLLLLLVQEYPDMLERIEKVGVF